MNPYQPQTNINTSEETIEAIDNSLEWLYRIKGEDEMSNTDINAVISELESDKETIKQSYKIHTTETGINNFVWNHADKVKSIILESTIDEEIRAFNELEEHLHKQFGYVDPMNLSKEELKWLVARELQKTSLPKIYENCFEKINLERVGEQPERWDSYPSR